MTVKDNILNEVNHIPPLSESAEKLIQMMGDPNHDVQSVLNIVQTDSALTTKVLTVVNSAALALREPITSIARAISYLGDKKILNIALEFCVNDLFQKPLEGYEGKQGALWEHNLCVAIASKEVARFAKKEISPDIAYTGGILHDMGKSILSDYLKGKAAECVTEVNEGNASDYLAAEEKILGTNHCIVGSNMARSWGLPSPLPEIIEYHHHPAESDPEIRGIVYAVHLGDIIAMNVAADMGSDVLQYRLDGNYIEHFEISPESMPKILLKVGEDYNKTKSLLLGERGTQK